MLITAQKEFQLFVKDKAPVICAYVRNMSYDDYDNHEQLTPICLPLGFTEDQYFEFLAKLNFTYNSGYGSQNLDGMIWFKDGSWATRGEYDGSEWWEYHKLPQVPTYLYPEEA
jgi:hypothetical protein